MHSESIRLIERWGFEPTPGTVLIAGSKRYPNAAPSREYAGPVIGVDVEDGPGVDVVHDLSHPLAVSVAHVDCCSVLEHCQDPFSVARTLQDCMVMGASILLTVPFVWREHGYPDDYWRFTRSGIRRMFPQIEWLRLSYAVDGAETDIVRVMKEEKELGLPRMPRAEVIGWGVKVCAS